MKCWQQGRMRHRQGMCRTRTHIHSILGPAIMGCPLTLTEKYSTNFFQAGIWLSHLDFRAGIATKIMTATTKMILLRLVLHRLAKHVYTRGGRERD